MKTLRILVSVAVTWAAVPLRGDADFSVSPRAETPAFSGSETADDPTIWLHPTDPSLSLVIGTNKDAGDPNRGLHLYDLDGTLLRSLTGKRHNNVDVRYNFTLAGKTVDILASTNRTDDTIDLFTIDPVTRTLSPAGSIPSGFDDPYGVALWDDEPGGRYYVFISDDDGNGSIRQFELSDDDGSIGGTLVRSWNVGSLVEGLTVDDRRGGLFVGEEDQGIWLYDADPAAGTGTGDRIPVGQGPGQVKANDVEGLNIFGIFDPQNQCGYLLASEQGNDSFAILERYDQDGDGNLYEYLGRFGIVAGNGLDGVGDTDGIGVISSALGPAFPEGLFVAQDGANSPSGQNYKLVSWADVVGEAEGGDPSLVLHADPDFDPRAIPGWFRLSSVADGNWNASATWNRGTLTPTEAHAAVVTGYTVTVTEDGSAFSLSIDDGGKLVVGSGKTLNVAGAVAAAGSGGTGQLILNGGSITADTVTLADGVTLSGSGTVLAPLRVQSGAAVSPGTSTGILSTGSVSLETGSTLAIELNGPAAGNGYGQLNVAGEVDLGGATLDLSLGYAPSGGHTFVIVNNDLEDEVGGRFAGYPDDSSFELGGYPLRIDYQGGDGNDVALSVPFAEVTKRNVFYHNSAFDVTEDDPAVATDKVALRPGDPQATCDNYTSYSRGINGIIIEMDYLPEGVTPDSGDFEFTIGNDDTPGDWDEAPMPEISFDQGEGYTDRVTLTWDDYQIRNTWLEVTVLAAGLGMDENDVFYFGNAVGEACHWGADAEVNETDVLLAQDNPHNFFNPAEVTCPYDYNRDGRVNATDMLISRSNSTDASTALSLITVPESEGAGHLAAVPEPSTFALLAIAAAATLVCNRRRRRRA